MLRKFVLASALMAVATLPAFAEDNCQVPTPPPPVDGATLAQPQMVAAIKAAKDYIAASDVYQQCVGDYINAQKQEAARNKVPFDNAIAQAETAKVDANQASKQKVGDEINAAIGAYKKAHPSN